MEKTAKKMLNIRIDEDLKIKLDIYCATHQTNITELLTGCIIKIVGEERK